MHVIRQPMIFFFFSPLLNLTGWSLAQGCYSESSSKTDPNIKAISGHFHFCLFLLPASCGGITTLHLWTRQDDSLDSLKNRKCQVVHSMYFNSSALSPPKCCSHLTLRFLTDETFYTLLKDKFKHFCNFFVDLKKNVNLLAVLIYMFYTFLNIYFFVTLMLLQKVKVDPIMEGLLSWAVILKAPCLGTVVPRRSKFTTKFVWMC